MAPLPWLTARPVAHRGLHGAAAGVVENTASAFAAAAAAGYGIELDVQITADGEAMVHHDAALGRLTDGEGRLAARAAPALKRAPFRGTTDRMMTLGDVCDLVGHRVPLLVEIKSRFDADARLARRVIDVLQWYGGRAAAMSFDPYQLEALRAAAPSLPRGIVAERRFRDEDAPPLNTMQTWALARLLHAWRTRPHFVAYRVADLPDAAPLLSRRVFGVPVLAWTVRTPEDRERAARWADAMIFEGFRP